MGHEIPNDNARFELLDRTQGLGGLGTDSGDKSLSSCLPLCVIGEEDKPLARGHDIVGDMWGRARGVYLGTLVEKFIGGLCCVEDYYILRAEPERKDGAVLFCPLSELWIRAKNWNLEEIA